MKRKKLAQIILGVVLIFSFSFIFAISGKIQHDQTFIKNGLLYQLNQTIPYTGIVVEKTSDDDMDFEEETSYRNGVKDGPFISNYLDSGEKAFVGTYKGNKQVGIWKWYYNESGILREEWSYNENGVKNGTHRSWYSDGKIQQISNWKDGKLHGKSESFWANGKSQETSYWKNGNKQNSNFYEFNEESILKNTKSKLIGKWEISGKGGYSVIEFKSNDRWVRKVFSFDGNEEDSYSGIFQLTISMEKVYLAIKDPAFKKPMLLTFIGNDVMKWYEESIVSSEGDGVAVWGKSK